MNPQPFSYQLQPAYQQHQQVQVRTVEWFIVTACHEAFIQHPEIAPTELYLHAAELAAILRDAKLLSTREEMTRWNNQAFAGSGSLTPPAFTEP